MAVTVLKFLFFEQGVSHFHFAPGFTNYVASLASQSQVGFIPNSGIVRPAWVEDSVIRPEQNLSVFCLPDRVGHCVHHSTIPGAFVRRSKRLCSHHSKMLCSQRSVVLRVRARLSFPRFPSGSQGSANRAGAPSGGQPVSLRRVCVPTTFKI